MQTYSISREKLQLAMAKIGLRSLAELSRKSHLHRNTLYPLINGERSPYSSSYIELCKTLRVSPQDLLDSATESVRSEIFSIAESIIRTFSVLNSNLVVFLFGSRASGTHKTFSDYDLGLTGGENTITATLFLKIKEHVSQLADDLPVKVDILNFDAAPLSFIRDFDSALEFLAGDPSSLQFLRGRLNGIKTNSSVL